MDGRLERRPRSRRWRRTSARCSTAAPQIPGGARLALHPRRRRLCEDETACRGCCDRLRAEGSRARPEDIDELGHVNNAAWVRWIQDMATAHWRAVADPAHVDAYVWVVTRHEIDYLRAVGPAKP
jgi:hypothetical protein